MPNGSQSACVFLDIGLATNGTGLERIASKIMLPLGHPRHIPAVLDHSVRWQIWECTCRSFLRVRLFTGEPVENQLNREKCQVRPRC